MNQLDFSFFSILIGTPDSFCLFFFWFFFLLKVFLNIFLFANKNVKRKRKNTVLIIQFVIFDRFSFENLLISFI